jgi:hypothetical protein
MFPLAVRRCPVCGQPGQACGGPAEAQPDTVTATTTDHQEGRTVAELREYNVTINGLDTRMQLTEKEAKRLGATSVPEGGGDEDDAEVGAKARTASNKSRTVTEEK